MTIMVRPATEADLVSLLALYAQLHPDEPALSIESARRIWPDIATQAGRTILVAVLGEAVVGTVDCAVLPNLTRGGRPFMLVENVVVGAAYRRRGAGTALLAAAMDLARSAGCYKAQLLSRASRTGAHAFYESFGFQTSAQGYRRYLDES